MAREDELCSPQTPRHNGADDDDDRSSSDSDVEDDGDSHQVRTTQALFPLAMFFEFVILCVTAQVSGAGRLPGSKITLSEHEINHCRDRCLRPSALPRPSLALGEAAWRLALTFI